MLFDISIWKALDRLGKMCLGWGAEVPVRRKVVEVRKCWEGRLLFKER